MEPQGVRLIRPATQDDVQRLHEIAHDAYLIYVSRIGKAPAPMLADFTAAVQAAQAWVVSGDPIPGYIVMCPQEDFLFLENVAVDPLLHGQGHGRALLDFAEGYARQHSLRAIRLYTNVHMTENRSLYPSLGYREIARRSEGGFERVYFEKPIVV